MNILHSHLEAIACASFWGLHFCHELRSKIFKDYPIRGGEEGEHVLLVHSSIWAQPGLNDTSIEGLQADLLGPGRLEWRLPPKKIKHVKKQSRRKLRCCSIRSEYVSE